MTEFSKQLDQFRDLWSEGEMSLLLSRDEGASTAWKAEERSGVQDGRCKGADPARGHQWTIRQETEI